MDVTSLAKHPNSSRHIFVVFGFHRVFAFVELHFAHIDYLVGTLDDQVDLRLFLRILRCRPRIHLRDNARYAEAFLNLPMVVKAQLLEGETCPSVVLPCPDLVLPERFVGMAELFDELVIK